MPELKRLTAGDAPAVLAFELENRAYFAASISDRGDEFFDQFADRDDAMLAEQEAGTGAFYMLVAEDGSVLGRFNLYRIQDGGAELGYRVAQRVAGRGVATAAVRELCRLAAARHGLRTLRAAVSHGNVASQRVLAKAGFTSIGPAGPAHLGGKPGTWYQRDLNRPDRLPEHHQGDRRLPESRQVLAQGYPVWAGGRALRDSCDRTAAGVQPEAGGPNVGGPAVGGWAGRLAGAGPQMAKPVLGRRAPCGPFDHLTSKPVQAISGRGSWAGLVDNPVAGGLGFPVVAELGKEHRTCRLVIRPPGRPSR